MKAGEKSELTGFTVEIRAIFVLILNFGILKHSKLLGGPSCRAKLQKILISSAKRCLQFADELNELVKMLFGLLFRISEAFEYSFRI